MCAYTVDCLLGREAETDPAGGGLDDLKGGQRKVELDCGKGLRFLRFRLCSTMGRFLAIYKAAALEVEILECDSARGKSACKGRRREE